MREVVLFYKNNKFEITNVNELQKKLHTKEKSNIYTWYFV